MASMNPYLNFPGNAEEAFNFYKSVFGCEFGMVNRFGEMPQSGELPEEDRNKILHISMDIAPGCTLMGSDALPSMGFTVNVGNNNYIHLAPDSREQAKAWFDGLSAGGKVEMPLDDTFWGAYFGSFADKYGTLWMIDYMKPQ